MAVGAMKAVHCNVESRFITQLRSSSQLFSLLDLIVLASPRIYCIVQSDQSRQPCSQLQRADVFSKKSSEKPIETLTDQQIDRLSN